MINFLSVVLIMVIDFFLLRLRYRNFLFAFVFVLTMTSFISCKTNKTYKDVYDQSARLQSISDENYILMLFPYNNEDMSYFFKVCQKEDNVIIEESCTNAFRSNDNAQVVFDFLDMALLSSVKQYTPAVEQIQSTNADILSEMRVKKAQTLGTTTAVGSASLIMLNQLINKSISPLSNESRKAIVDMTFDLELNKIASELESSLKSVTAALPNGFTKQLFSSSNGITEDIIDMQRQYVQRSRKLKYEKAVAGIDLSIKNANPQLEKIRLEIIENQRNYFLPRLNAIIQKGELELNQLLQRSNYGAAGVPSASFDSIFYEYIEMFLRLKKALVAKIFLTDGAKNQANLIADSLADVHSAKSQLLLTRAQEPDGAFFNAAKSRAKSSFNVFKQTKTYVTENAFFANDGKVPAKITDNVAKIPLAKSGVVESVEKGGTKLAKKVLRPLIIIGGSAIAVGGILYGVTVGKIENEPKSDAGSDISQNIQDQATMVFEDPNDSLQSSQIVSEVFIENLDAIISVDQSKHKEVNSVNFMLQELGKFIRENISVTDFGKNAIAKYCLPVEDNIKCNEF